MISPETLAIGKGPEIGAASAIAGVTSNAAQATVNMIFRIEVSPFQLGHKAMRWAMPKRYYFQSTRRSHRCVVKKYLVRPTELKAAGGRFGPLLAWAREHLDTPLTVSDGADAPSLHLRLRPVPAIAAPGWQGRGS
jgi:hypothetical protein